MSTNPITLRFTGDYSLEASVTLATSASFVDKHRPAIGGAVLDLALLLEGSWHTVGGRIDQHQNQVRARLRLMPRDEAMTQLQQLAGIGPFSAELILLRGVGDADAFPETEKRLHRAMAAAYHLGDDPDLNTLERIADGWQPYRSWVGLLLRNTVSK